jgi:hypothetical protein
MHAMNIGGTALIAAVAAVVAAALGAWGAVRAARHNSGTQRASQHEHWRRQGRREAYAAFINLATDYNPIAVRAVRLAWTDAQRSPNLQSLLDQAAELDGPLAKAAAVVEVEGPEDVAVAARELAGSLHMCIRMARERHEPPQQLPGGQPYPPPRPLGGPRPVSPKKFRTLARRALDDPSAALG